MIKKIAKKIAPKFIKKNIKRALTQLLGESIVSNNMFDRLDVLKNLGFAPNYIFDVGAFKGNWTVETMRIFPEAKFLMLEAQPDKEIFLKEIILKHPNTKYEITLLGRQNSEAVNFYKMETGSSIYSEQTDAKREMLTLGMKTLDAVAPILNHGDTVFLKLDVQGAEIDVLNGASRIIPYCVFILLEASILNYNKDAPLVGEIFTFLNEKGFVLFDICEQKRTNDDLLMQADLLFTKKHSAIRNKYNFK